MYLQKKVNDETPVIDSVVVAADGSFSFTLPAGVDVYELNAAKEAKKEILVSEIPVVVTIATELRTAKDSSTYETLSIEAVGDEQKVYEQGTQMIMTASFMQLGRMFALSNILQGKDTTMTLDSAVVFFDMMDARMNESIYNFVDSAKNNYGVAYFIKDYMIRSMPFDTVQVAYDALTDRVKQSSPGCTRCPVFFPNAIPFPMTRYSRLFPSSTPINELWFSVFAILYILLTRF